MDTKPMTTNLVDEMLGFFGLKVEQRQASPPPGVTRVDGRAAISAGFAADALHQQNDSAFFGQRRTTIVSNAADLGADPSTS